MRTPSVEASTSSAEVPAELAPDGPSTRETPTGHQWKPLLGHGCETIPPHGQPSPEKPRRGEAHWDTWQEQGLRGQEHVTAVARDGAWLTWDTVDATHLARISPADLPGQHTDERIQVEPPSWARPGP